MPADSIAGRALVVVIAIMTFLACLTAGGAMLVAEASQGWRADVSRDVTIQIKPRPGDDIEALVATAAGVAARAPGVADVHAYTKAESEKLLAPWLGEGFDLGQLPIPRLIVVHMRSGHREDLEPLRAALAAGAPAASLDDHRLWLSRLDTMADAVVVFAAALFALMIVAMATAIGFATRGAMAGNREIIEVLHFVGAADSYIARQFQRHFLRLGLKGAAIGGARGGAVLRRRRRWSRLGAARSPGGEEIAALFGAFALGVLGYAAIVVICLAIAALTGFLSREIVFRQLQEPAMSAAAAGPCSTTTRRTAMIKFRSLVFNLAFYVNLIVLMILGLPIDSARAVTAFSSWRGCGVRPRFGCSRRSATCASSIAASKTFPRAVTSSPPSTNPSSRPSRCSNTHPTSPSCSSGNSSTSRYSASISSAPGRSRSIAIAGHSALTQIIAQAREVVASGPPGLHLSRGHAPPARRAAALQVRRRRALR